VDLPNGFTWKIFTSDIHSYPYWPITLKLLEHQLPETSFRVETTGKHKVWTVFFFHLWGKQM
jgi:hypothetical protein